MQVCLYGEHHVRETRTSQHHAEDCAKCTKWCWRSADREAGGREEVVAHDAHSVEPRAAEAGAPGIDRGDLVRREAPGKVGGGLVVGVAAARGGKLEVVGDIERRAAGKAAGVQRKALNEAGGGLVVADTTARGGKLVVDADIARREAGNTGEEVVAGIGIHLGAAVAGTAGGLKVGDGCSWMNMEAAATPEAKVTDGTGSWVGDTEPEVGDRRGQRCAAGSGAGSDSGAADGGRSSGDVVGG